MDLQFDPAYALILKMMKIKMMNPNITKKSHTVTQSSICEVYIKNDGIKMMNLNFKK